MIRRPMRLAAPMALLIASAVGCAGPAATPIASNIASLPTSLPSVSISLPSELPSVSVSLPSALPSVSISLPSGSISLPSALPSVPIALPSQHSDPALEALLPDEVDGTTLSAISFNGSEVITAQTEAQFQPFLRRLGRSPEDVSGAVALDTTGVIKGNVNALQVRGADPEELLAATSEFAQQDASTPLDVAESTIGGKLVTTLTPQGLTDPSAVRYLYVRDDVVFQISGADRPTVEKLIAALP